MFVWAGLGAIALLIVPAPMTLAQEEALETEAPDTEITETTLPGLAPGGVYFADVVVRGQPVFQIGSLPDLSAPERAQLINRRIAGLLSRVEVPEPVDVQSYPERDLATLQIGNRIIMTVTDQDAQDFGLEVDELAQQWAAQLNQALDRPPLAIDVVQRLNTTVRQFLQDAIDSLPSLIGAIIVIAVTGLIAAAVRHLITIWAQQTEGDRSTEILIGRLGYGAIWFLGTVVALGVLGLDFAALLGALGLTSVAIGFSLKDVLSNYISGVILLAARPFRLGDQVVIGDYEGSIVQIQLRAMTMKTYDGRTVYIPNQRVFQASIINNTASPKRRSHIMVGIDYDADLATAKRTIFQAISQVQGVESDPVPVVLVRELAASTVNLEIRFWVDSRRAEFLETTSRTAQAIKESLQRADIDMPTEIQTLIFRNSPIDVDANLLRQADPAGAERS